MKPAVLSAKEIEALLEREFPQVFHAGSGLTVEHVEFGVARVRQTYSDKHIRPGGTVSGPTMMALADFAMYVAVFSAAGPVPLAVTTNLNINFLRKPARADLIADAKLLKHGKRLVVGEVTLRSDGRDDPVAHVTSTYSMPPA
jgi:uncharacterized protein (TIGR00369 family)